MKRYQPLFIGIASMAALGLVVSGSPIFMLMVVPIVGLALVFAFTGRGRALPDAAWSVAPNGQYAISDGEGKIVAMPRRTVASLGRVEGVQLALSPWFGAGIGFFIVVLLVFLFLFGFDLAPRSAIARTFPWFVHPFAGMLVIASHRAVTRSEREGTEELFSTCPVVPSTRTAGFLASAWTPILGVVVFGVLVVAGAELQSNYVHGPLNDDDVAYVLSSLVLVVGAVALGVALGRWVRFGLAPVVVVVAVGFASIMLSSVGGSNWNPYTQLATAPTIEGPSPVFTDPPGWFHLLWIVGLTAVVTVVAIAHDRRNRGLLIAGGVAVVVVIAAGLGATAEMSSAAADRIAQRVLQPELDQTCRAVTPQVQVCTFDHHAGLIDKVVNEVTPTALALPSAVGELTLRQIYTGRYESLPPEVRRLLPTTAPLRPTGELELPSNDDLDPVPSGHASALANGAVGLPAAADEELMPTVAAGQARGVVALWLAARGLSDDEMRRALTSDDSASADSFERGSLGGTGMCSVPSVVWSAQDLEAARALIEVPESQVAAVIAADWDRWVNPSTGTDELLAAVGLAPVGPFDHVEAQPGNPC